MVEVKKGDLIVCAKTGESRNGTWAYAEVKAEKGFDAMKLWFANADGAQEGKSYEVDEIVAVKKSARKYKAKDGTEKWVDEYSANVKVKASDVPEGFSKLDEDIPF